MEAQNARNLSTGLFAEQCLAAGVEQEEAGEKWQAGDPIKALRFFQRAIDTYSSGIAKIKCFDLLFNRWVTFHNTHQRGARYQNRYCPFFALVRDERQCDLLILSTYHFADSRARVQLHICQTARLHEQVRDPLENLLETARKWSLEALKMRPYDPDALFDFAQTHIALAETACSEDDSEISSKKETGNLSYALDALDLCLRVQMEKLQPSGDEMLENDLDISGHIDMNDPGDQQEFYATMDKPIDTKSVIETILAIYEAVYAMTTACKGDPKLLARMQEYLSPAFSHKYLPLAEQVACDNELRLRVLLCQGHQAAVKYKAKLLDLPAFLDALSSLVMANVRDQHIGLMLNFVNTLMPAAVSLARDIPHEKEQAVLRTRWLLLTRALDELTFASKLKDVPDLAFIHTLRGDCELLRYRMSTEPRPFPAAIEAQAVLIKNARVFYNAAALCLQASAKQSPESVSEEIINLEVKRAVVSHLLGDQVVQDLFASHPELTKKALEEALSEDLLTRENIAFLTEVCDRQH